MRPEPVEDSDSGLMPPVFSEITVSVRPVLRFVSSVYTIYCVVPKGHP